MMLKGRMGAVFSGIIATCAALAPGVTLALDASLSAPGAPEELRDRLTTVSAVMAAEARGLDTVQDLLAAAQSDYNTLIQVLYDQGYFSPVIHVRLDGREAASIQPLNLPGSVGKIEITVDTGPVFRFGRADIAPLAPGTRIPKAFAPGRTATTRHIRDAAVAGLNGWREAGHAKAEVGAQRIVADHPAARLDAQIRLRPGPKLRFGKMTVTGPTDVRERSIQRIAGLPTGKVYDPAMVQKVRTRLRRTGTFTSVSLKEAQQPNPDGTLDFNAAVEDLPKRRLSFGAELSSSEGLDLSAAWMHRNLFGGAERLRFEANIRNIGSSDDIDGRIGLRLDRPDRLGPDDSVYYLFELERLDRTHYDVTHSLLGVGVRRVFSDDLFGELAITASHSSADDAFGANRRFRYLGLPLRMEWDKRDNPVNATKGHYLNAKVMPYAGVSGTPSGTQLILDGRGYRSLGPSGRIVLAGRVQFGSVLGAAQSDISPELLFFSGGAGTVRGQPYESLGIPAAPGGGTAGGRAFLGASVELRSRITDKISAVGFFDYGAVDADPFLDGNSASHSGAGLGLRYDLGGFGPIRFDLGFPVDGTTGDGMQFYVGIGQAF